MPVPYSQTNPDGSYNGTTYWPTALTGRQHPNAYYKNFGTDAAGFVSANKTWQLDAATWNPVGGTNAAIDAQWGGTKMEEIADGTSVSILFVESVGQNERMLQNGVSNGPNA